MYRSVDSDFRESKRLAVLAILVILTIKKVEIKAF
jgi:hypothetical protein